MSNFIDAGMLRRMFLSGAANLQNNKELIDKLNVFPVPDGDTGTNLSLTISYAVKEIEKAEDLSLTEVGKKVSKGSLMGARGNSGVILSQILRGFAQGIEGKDNLDTQDLSKALKKSSEVAYKAVIKPIEGTILTVIRETAEFSLKLAKKEKNMNQFLMQVVEYSKEVLEKTPDLLKALKEAGVVDSGGKGLVCLFEGMLEAYRDNDVKLMEISSGSMVHSHQAVQAAQSSQADIKFGYCTEFIIDTDEKNAEEIKDYMLTIGDSLAVVGDDGLVKVHVHTNDPGDALSKALSYGQLVTIKIENMRFQHENIVLEKGKEKEQEVHNMVQADEKETSSEQKKDREKYAFIATSAGDGLKEIFNNLGVEYIIEGGQTMNPSTEDFLKAISEANADNIIILPNNSNIIMAANQARDISEENIVVIPSKNIPHGISAMLAFDPQADIETNKINMSDAINYVKAGEVTYAVRDTKINEIEIKKGNIIGIADKEVKIAGEDVSETAYKFIEKIVDEDSSVISLYYGEDVSDAAAEELRARLEEKFEMMDVEAYKGGQPLYYYLVSVE